MGFARGAIPTPHHKLMAAPRHRMVKAPPPEFSPIKGKLKLSFWDNERDGVCVSSEEAFAKALWSVYCGLAEVFATEQEVHDFAAAHGWLNGADLTEVMDVMIAKGMSIGGTTYKDGSYSAVDYSNEDVLKSALTVGPVKIAIDADALPSGAGNHSGWYSTDSSRYRNTDHCVGLVFYGSAKFVYQVLFDAGLTDSPSVPAGLDPTTQGYAIFTWSTIGFVTHGWIMGTCTEAWVRNPTTVGQSPVPTPPPVPPVPPPPPGPVGWTTPVSAPVSGTVHIPPFGHFDVTGSAAVPATPVMAQKPGAVGINWDLLVAIGKLVVDVEPYGAQLVSDVKSAISQRSLAAFEQVARDLISMGADSKVRADLLRIVMDLGIDIPLGSVLLA